MALQGDTVWPWAQFYDQPGEDGVLTDADSVTFAAYDEKENVLVSPVNLDESHHYATGSYEYPFVLPKPPQNQKTVIYEFVGMVDGHPEVVRGPIPVTFIPTS